MATASISLVREQSEQVNPPRALWVPFALGRPLGSSEDPAFQTDVIRAALAMLATASGPTIEDYPIEAPSEAGPEQWACPVNLGPPVGGSRHDRLVAEVARLVPWAAETRRRRGRTLFGASGAHVDQAGEVAAALVAIAEKEPLPDRVTWAFEQPLLARHLADDLRVLYHEAVASQPGGGAPNHDALTSWIFESTALGEVLTSVADRLTEAGDPLSLLVRGLLIPEGHFRGGSAFPTR